MEVVSRRKGTNSRNGVVSGSVWESRMRFDEVKGGFKVFSNSDEDTPEVENDEKLSASTTTTTTTTSVGDNNNQVQLDKKFEMGPKPNVDVGGVVVSGKRKTWKSENLEGTPVQIATKKSELNKNLEEQFKELSASVDVMKKSPIQRKKTRSSQELSVAENGIDRSPIQIAAKRSELSKNLDEQYKELSVSVDGMKKSPIRSMKTRSSQELSPIQKARSGLLKKLKGVSGESSDGIGNVFGNERNAIQLRKVKSEISKTNQEPMSPNVNVRNSLQLVKSKSASVKEFDENGKSIVEFKKSQFEENKNKVVGSVDDSKKKKPIGIKKTRSEEEFGVCEEKVITSNVESQVKSSPSKVEKVLDIEKDDDEEEWDEVMQEDIDDEFEKVTVDVKEISVAEHKAKKIVIDEKKVQLSNERPVLISSIIKKQPPPISGQARSHHPSPTRTKPVPVSDEFQRIPRQHSNLQSLVDLVMWRDVSRSALIFGLGTFAIISSSYTQDLNISCISVLSYLGLFYLAAIFLFRSLIHRRAIEAGESSEYVVGEEEAVWVLKLLLPYINECLLKIRALFSGDPATTMKMAVLLFILARSGSSITIWKMSKLGFFGVFIVPKVCSSYSSQLTAYGTFWIRRFRDAWESCTHKKAVGFAIFTLVWNLSSIVARIWAVFMLYVGFRYYQQKMMREGWVGEEATTKAEDNWQGKVGGQRLVGRRSNLMETRKQKKPL